MKPRKTRSERYWAKVNKDGPIHHVLGTACWLWTAGIATGGYAQFFQGRGLSYHASHYAYFLATGIQPPKGIFVCHRCDNPSCVNPDHLFLGTVTDNNRDKMKKGRYVGNGFKYKTHCKFGHEFTPENTAKRGKPNERVCRICEHGRVKAWRHGRHWTGGMGRRGDINAEKTHCPKGHEYTPENTYRSAKGWRRCRTCILPRLKAAYQKRKSA